MGNKGGKEEGGRGGIAPRACVCLRPKIRRKGGRRAEIWGVPMKPKAAGANAA